MKKPNLLRNIVVKVGKKEELYNRQVLVGSRGGKKFVILSFKVKGKLTRNLHSEDSNS